MRSITRRPLLILLALLLLNPSWGAPETSNCYGGEADQVAILNPGFELGALSAVPKDWAAPEIPGYATTSSDNDPFEGAQCATMICESETAARFGNLIQRIVATPYRGKRLRFRAAVRTSAEDGGKARLWLRVDRTTPEGAPVMGAFDNMGNRPIASPEWKHYEIVADVAEDAARISLGMMFSGPGQAWIDDASLEVVGEEVAVTARSPQGAGSGAPQGDVKPGLFEILGAMVVAPAAKSEADLSGGDPNTVMREQDVLIPLPLSYRDQTPLSYELRVTPPASVNAVDVVRDGPDNFVLRVKLAEGRRGSVKITFKSIVLIGPSDFSSVPESAPFPETWPEDARPWLAATWCADSDHERIQAIASGIRAATNDVLEIIRRVQTATGNVFRLAQGRGKSLTAVEALDKQGSCTSCANLVAAVLRACGVPARIVAGYPSWSGPLQTHYIVEAYIPEYGWYPIESTMGRSPWPNFQQALVAIIPPKYEDRARAGARVGVAGGVPYLSLTELPGNDGSCIAVGAIENAMGCDHYCRAMQSLEGTSEQWSQAAAAARTKWESWLDGTHKLEAEGQLEFGDPSKMAKWKSVSEVIEDLDE
jgi:hypothetical protein